MLEHAVGAVTSGVTPDAGRGLVAVTTRPSTAWLVVLVIVTAVAVVVWRRFHVATLPPLPIEIGEARPQAGAAGGLEPPAVVGLLTSGYRVPDTAITATALDLARRGWIRLALTEDGELVVFLRGTGRDGDALAPFEQQVLNHLMARAFDGVTSASTMVASQGRVGRRWKRRFRNDVVRAARSRNLTRTRYRPIELLPVLAAAVVAAWAAWSALRSGRTDLAIAESLLPRAVWAVCALTVVALVVRCLRCAVAIAELPTEPGQRRAGQWLGYRRRLVAGIPEHASVVTSSEQQHALAMATVMGVTPHVVEQIPVVPDDPHAAWSDAGGLPHVVRVRYPFRPGYGRNPVMVAALGGVVLAASQWVQRFLHRVADGEALESWIDTFPDQAERIRDVVGVVGDAMWVPTAWAVWAIAAGLLDTFSGRERTGLVVRVRRPVDVVPLRRVFGRFAERDRFAVFVAIDDGRRRRVTAWTANERTAVPEGVQARVTATRLLGHVRSSAPVGTSTRVGVP